MLSPADQQEGVSGRRIVQPVRAGVCIVRHKGAALAVGVVGPGAVQHAPGKEDAAASLERYRYFRPPPRTVDLVVDLLRRVNRRLVRMERVAVAAGDDVEATVGDIHVVQRDPQPQERVRVRPQIVRVLMERLPDTQMTRFVDYGAVPTSGAGYLSKLPPSAR